MWQMCCVSSPVPALPLFFCLTPYEAWFTGKMQPTILTDVCRVILKSIMFPDNDIQTDISQIVS